MLLYLSRAQEKTSARLCTNLPVTEAGGGRCTRNRRAGTIFDWGVNIMRATFRGVHKSVINDQQNTLLDLVSEYNIIMM